MTRLKKVGIVPMLVLASVGCGNTSGGGGGGGGGGGNNNPDSVYACFGSVTDGNPADPTIPLPGAIGASTPSVFKCEPTGGPAPTVADCQNKCNIEKQEFESFFESNDDNEPANFSTANIVCNVTSAATQPLLNGSCPNPDPPGLPEGPFSGGPTQYLANLSGVVTVSVDTGSPVGTVSQSPAATGQLAYSIAPRDLNCPPQGCSLLITDLDVFVNSFELSASLSLLVTSITLFDENVTGMHIQNAGWVVGTWQPNGRFDIPAGTANAAITLNDNGQPMSTTLTNGSAITGTIDPIGGTVSFDSFSQQQSGSVSAVGFTFDTTTTITVNPLSGPQIASPPVAVINVPTTIQCNKTDAAAVTLNGTPSHSMNNDIHFYLWQVNGGGPTLFGAITPATLNLGTNQILLNVYNSTLAVGTAEETVTVVDTTPPTIETIPATLTQTNCNPSSQTTVLTVPTATDICSPTVNVTGAITSANGTALGTPLPIVNGTVSLPPGVYVVTWTATDQSGNFSSATQTITIRPGVEANGSISIDDGAVVQLPSGAPAAIGNTGTGTVTIGVLGTTGDVLTEGPVFLRSRAIVQGNVEAAGALTQQPPVSVSGTIATGVKVPLPAGPNLSGVVFPPLTGQPVDLEPNVAKPLAPGAYPSVSVKQNATLTMSTGTYFVGSLDLEPGSKLNLNQTAGPIQLYVQSSIIDRGQIQSTSGTAGGFVLGYAGTSTFFVQSPFLAGTVLAPNADVVIASLGADAFTGELFAQSIEVQPDATLTCSSAGIMQPLALRGGDLSLVVDAPPANATEAPSVPGSGAAPSADRPPLVAGGGESASGGCSLSASRATHGAPCAFGWIGAALASLGMRRRKRAKSRVARV